MDEYIRKSDAIEQALAQIHLLDITVRERILNFDGKAQAKTNADRIRAMTDEELAVWIAETSHCSDWCILNEKCKSKLDNEACPNVWLEWLREESEGE